MQLKDFVLRLNTYSQVDHDLPVDRLIYYDLNPSRQDEIFSCNFYYRYSVLNDLLFSFDNHHNLLLTNNDYNHALYIIVNVKDDYYAYYRLSHRGGLTFVIFKIYSPGVHYIEDVRKKASFRFDCDRCFSTTLWIAHRPSFDLLNPQYAQTLDFNNISDDLFLTIAKLNNLIEPYKLLYVIR